MIKRVSANNASFRTTGFSAGFNVVMADRTKEATKKDSRNGLGKSTLIEIIHFCLGATALRNKGLLVPSLSGWSFSLDVDISGRHLTVSRAVDDPWTIGIEGDVSSLPILPRTEGDRSTYNLSEWNSMLGSLFFDLRPSKDGRQYRPSWRSLISYFIRRGKDAFLNPFEHTARQAEWDKQLHNAFLLGLAWEDAADWQQLKDRKKLLDTLRKAGEAGIVKGFMESLGDLEARRVRLTGQADQEADDLRTFRVHPQYEKIQADANRLTAEIHDLVNANMLDRRLLEVYESSLTEEQPPIPDSLARMYAEAGVALPGSTLRRIEEVQQFHNTIVANRREFLSAEVDRLRRYVARREDAIQGKTRERASVMNVLQTHGALDEYTALQTRHMDTVNELNAVSTMIENLKTFESGQIEVKIAQEMLHLKARQDYEERKPIREKAITLFNSYSERLYNAPGRLVLDVRPTGFHFDVEIERSGSAGIDNMKIFCYDLTLAALWAERTPSPRVLIHDSTIFDGVDERQRAIALQLAAEESERAGFQYICTLNSDNVPWREFPPSFNLGKYVRLQLTDATVDGCLMGMRY